MSATALELFWKKRAEKAEAALREIGNGIDTYCISCAEKNPHDNHWMTCDKSPMKAALAEKDAESAVYREALITVCCSCEYLDEIESPECGPCQTRKALSSDAGKAMLDRLAKLEALFAKAQVVQLQGGGGFIGILAGDALEALDGKEG